MSTKNQGISKVEEGQVLQTEKFGSQNEEVSSDEDLFSDRDWSVFPWKEMFVPRQGFEEIVEDTYNDIDEGELPSRYSVIMHDANNKLNVITAALELVQESDDLSSLEREVFERLEDEVGEATDAVQEGRSELSDENIYDTPEEAFRGLQEMIDPSDNEYLAMAERSLEELNELFDYVDSYERILEGEEEVYEASYEDIISPLEDDGVDVVVEDSEVTEFEYISALGQLNRTIRKNDREHAEGEMGAIVSSEREGDQRYAVFEYESPGSGNIMGVRDMLSLDAESERGTGLGIVNYVVNEVGGDIKSLGENEDGNFELCYRIPVHRDEANPSGFGYNRTPVSADD